MNIQIENKLDVKDFAEAERITPARGHKFFWYSFYATRVVFVLMAIMAAFFLVVLIGMAFQTSWSWNRFGRFLAALGFIAFFFWTRMDSLWLNRYGGGVRRQRDYKYKDFDAININDTGIKMESLSEDIPIDWDQFVGFHEGDRIFLLVKTEQYQEILVPKTGLSANDQNELRQIFKAKIGQW